MLWHKDLDHISRDRIEWLIKEEILYDLDLYFSMYIYCIKENFLLELEKEKELEDKI